jgi:hypothetical protein
MEDEMEMELEYTLIDCSTDLIYGSYETFNQAREHAEDFERWEIINAEGNLVDWSPKPKAVAPASAEAA